MSAKNSATAAAVPGTKYRYFAGVRSDAVHAAKTGMSAAAARIPINGTSTAKSVTSRNDASFFSPVGLSVLSPPSRLYINSHNILSHIIVFFNSFFENG